MLTKTKQHSFPLKKNTLTKVIIVCTMMILSFSSFAQKTIRIETKNNLLLPGVDANAQYKLTKINKGNFSRLKKYEGKIFSGEFLMTAGLQFDMYTIMRALLYNL